MAFDVPPKGSAERMVSSGRLARPFAASMGGLFGGSLGILARVAREFLGRCQPRSDMRWVLASLDRPTAMGTQHEC